jgi:serine/threonine-protein kinase
MIACGSRIGSYELLSPLGKGGMGEVYRAKDLKLGREVAIKVLSDQFASDLDRLARFQREAQVLASLNHPNIAAIYGLEETEGTKALVLEFVPGETLAERIARGPISLDEALPIAKQIAEGLEAAHEQGISHRDLKPANIKITSDGVVKVLDFGLAKLTAPTGAAGSVPGLSMSPTITSPAIVTGVGMLLGTAAYMSPEQAKGREADKRSDVWAFGCVLYEMLTGKRAFDGEDVAETLAAVLTQEPNWEAVQRSPKPLVLLLRACLRKRRSERVGDLAAALLVLREQRFLETVTPIGNARGPARRWVAGLAVGLALGLGVVAVVAWSKLARPPATEFVTRSSILLSGTAQLGIGGAWQVIAISPDGRRVVYAAANRLYLRSLDSGEATVVAGTEGTTITAARAPFFSPDGQWLGFWQQGQLKKVPVNGGPPVPIADVTSTPWGVTWGKDNNLTFGAGAAGVWKVASAGGKPERVVDMPSGALAYGAQVLPGGRAILFTSAMAGSDFDDAKVVIQTLDDHRQTILIERARDARYLPTGHLAYAANGGLMAVRFDVQKLAITGPPVALVEDVSRSAGTPAAYFAVSDTGTLIYISGPIGTGGTTPKRLVWVDRQGREEPTRADAGPFVYPRLSPDGGTVALTVRDRFMDIQLVDLARGNSTRFTTSAADDRYSLWLKGPRLRIAFSSRRGLEPTILAQPADGSGEPDTLASGKDVPYQFLLPTSTDRAGQRIVITAAPGGGGRGVANDSPTPDLFLLSIGDTMLRPLVKTEFSERNGEVSPDDRWLAYESDESGHFEVYVRGFPESSSSPKLPVSHGGGTQPAWSRDGRELFYLSGDALMRVQVRPGGEWNPGPPTQVFKGSFVWSVPAFTGRQYDVAPDGRFLVLKSADSESATIMLVQNWFTELRQLVGKD